MGNNNGYEAHDAAPPRGAATGHHNGGGHAHRGLAGVVDNGDDAPLYQSAVADGERSLLSDDDHIVDVHHYQQHHHGSHAAHGDDEKYGASSVGHYHRRRVSAGEHKLGWAQALPADVFINSFSFLSIMDLAHVTSVSHSWQSVAADASLWRTLDLSRLYSRVDDILVARLLAAPRFRELEILNLEGCSAITNATLVALQGRSATLKQLFLSECSELTAQRIIELVHSCPSLERLELYHVTDDLTLAPIIAASRPALRLGFFWLEYCAAAGLTSNGDAATCRHEEGFGDRGCWGAIVGRLVYDNTFYHRGGNFPRSVLYSCATHHSNDLHDADYHKCEVCDCLFRITSMWLDTPICRTCYDRENLQNKGKWVALTSESIAAFGFQDIVGRTLRIADRKNLPDTLKSQGSIACRLDYKLPDAGAAAAVAANGGNDASVIDPSNVPMPIFLQHNGWRVDDQVSQAKTIFRRAAKAKDTRALLVFDSKDNVEVLSDQRLILDGKDGEEHMQLTLQAWQHALGIIYPIIAVMAVCLYYVEIFPSFDPANRTPEVSDYTSLLYDNQVDTVSAFIVFIIVGGLLAFVVILLFLWYRFREQCERFFKAFLVADILLIYTVGGGILIWMFISHMKIRLEIISFALITCNMGVAGMASLYVPVPPIVHRAYLVILNAIMAIMLVETLPLWILFFFVTILALLDALSELTRFRAISPFLIPQSIELLYETPRILYQVGTLRLRAADLMWYGLLVSVVHSSLQSVVATFTVVCAALVIVLFIAPFMGRRFRPLPAAFAAIVVLLLINDSLLVPYTVSLNYLRTSSLTL